MEFQNLHLHSSLLHNLEKVNLIKLTSVQELAIPQILNKKDVLAIAPTGTGKTEAFCIPIIENYLQDTDSLQLKTLILNPTRELAMQTKARFDGLASTLNIRSISICGGQAYDNQIEELGQDHQVIIATPGRLIDLFDKKIISFEQINRLVIDEFDQLLHLGFMKEVNQIINNLPSSRQNLFFSATLPNDILRIANKTLKDPFKINLKLETKNSTIEEKVFYVDKADKKSLIKYLIQLNPTDQLLIFTRTTHGVDRIVQDLKKEGFNCEALYGDKSQKTRVLILDNFRTQNTQILVSTDLLARGVDIEHLPVVINYEIPDSAEIYMHRIGRTGRNGLNGKAYTFCDAEDNQKWIQLQVKLAKQIKIEDQHPYLLSWQKMISSSESKKGKNRKR